MIHSLHGTKSGALAAVMKLHTGSESMLRPSMGEWVSYGLGTENQNLPSFITICPTSLHGSVDNFGAAFLPAKYQVVRWVRPGITVTVAEEAKFEFLENSRATPVQQRMQLDLLEQMNRRRLYVREDDSQLEARLQTFELAFRMQTAAPEAMDVAKESKVTRRSMV